MILMVTVFLLFNYNTKTKNDLPYIGLHPAETMLIAGRSPTCKESLFLRIGITALPNEPVFTPLGGCPPSAITLPSYLLLRKLSR